MSEAQIQEVRRFARTVTERVGVLQDRFLGRDRPIGAARLLWEIGEEEPDVRRLRARLGLDSGYVSRLLRSLEADGLVTVAAQRDDRRVRTVRLTAAGLAERGVLDGRGDDVAVALLESLTDAERSRLVGAMREVDRLLTGSAVTVTPIDPEHPDARYCLQEYAAELDRRFETGFDPARSVSADAAELRPPAGLLLAAHLHGQPVGCAALKLPAGAPGEVKRMWVAASARGLGIGHRLLSELEARAVAQGTRVLHLETNAALTEAIRLYRSAGYVEVDAFSGEPYAHHWFEKDIGP